jgi:putative membrane protein
MMGWLNHGHGMWGMGWFGSIVMVSFWVLIFLSIIHLVRSTAQSHEPSPFSQGRDPRDILKERYAKGEIETQEYHKKMEILR